MIMLRLEHLNEFYSECRTRSDVLAVSARALKRFVDTELLRSTWGVVAPFTIWLRGIAQSTQAKSVWRVIARIVPITSR